MRHVLHFGYNLLDDLSLACIETQAQAILNDIGLELQGDATSLEAMASVGARVEGSRIYVDADVLRQLIQSAPQEFVWQGRCSDRDVRVGADRAVVAPTFGPPKIRLDSGESRLGTIEDYRQLVRLCDQAKAMDSTGFLLCIAHENGGAADHMAMAQAHIELSEKPMMGTVLSDTALRDVATATCCQTEGQGAHCTLLHMINSTPPLVYQSNPLQCLRASSELGQGCVVTSYMMMGATAPVTTAACLAQGLAEILVGLALTQIYRPGSPVVGGIFATPFSMQYMGPVFGTPESHVVQLAASQLVRRLGVPVRGDGMLSSSKLNDAQSGYEGASGLGASLLAQSDLILHAAGWLEFGRTISLEKFKSDLDLLKNTPQLPQLSLLGSVGLDGPKTLEPSFSN